MFVDASDLYGARNPSLDEVPKPGCDNRSAIVLVVLNEYVGATDFIVHYSITEHISVASICDEKHAVKWHVLLTQTMVTPNTAILVNHSFDRPNQVTPKVILDPVR